MNITPNDPKDRRVNMQIFRYSTRKRRSLDSKMQALTVKETTSKAHMQVHTSRESREKQPGMKPGPNRTETGLGRPAWADRPSPFRAWFGAPFDLVASRAIYSHLAESHVKNSFLIHRHKTENKKQIGSRREHSWPSSSSGDSTPWSALHWVTLWGKVLVCPRGWRGILSCNHWTYVLNLLLSYSCPCWWCFNHIGRPACFGMYRS
jgi:hypothetical protein